MQQLRHFQGPMYLQLTHPCTRFLNHALSEKERKQRDTDNNFVFPSSTSPPACVTPHALPPFHLQQQHAHPRHQQQGLHQWGNATVSHAKEARISQEDWAPHDSVRMMRGGATASSTSPPQNPSAQPRYDKVPAPAYPPQVLFRYPNATPAPIRDTEVCDLCFPHQVSQALHPVCG